MADHHFSNAEIAQLFENVSAAMTLKGENRFKIIAYQNAQVAAEHATSSIYDLWRENNLNSVPGFGETIQNHLDELFTTGKVSHFEAAFKGIVPATFEFLRIPGVGPKTAEKIARSNISSIDELFEKREKLVEAVGDKTAQKILAAVAQMTRKSDQPQRMLLPYAQKLAIEVMQYLKTDENVLEIFPLGSLRRQVATIGDVDFAVASKNPKAVVEKFIAYPQVASVIDKGNEKASVMLKIGVRADLLVGNPDNFGSILQHFTGSKQHNIHLRKLTKAKGLSLSEKGITEIEEKDDDGDPILLKEKTEEAFYKALGMQYIPPEIREDNGEIEKAQAYALPTLVELSDIKGDLHMHSSFPIEPSHDLGADTIETMAKRAEELGYEYINMTEHNPSLSKHTDNQIIKLISDKKRYIEKINNSREIKVLNSLEIDILPNGALAVPLEGLKLLDVPVCSIHSKHNGPKDETTKRLLTALANPYLKILGHPTNRLLNRRDQSNIDWDIVLDAVKKHNKVLEVNASPDRLDLPDALVREAVDRSIKLCIDTDSHAVDQMDLMQYGVSVARRGWATKADIVNTYNWLDFAKFFGLE